MLTMARIEAIRDAYHRRGKSISQISKEQGVDRKTVRKYLEQDDFSEPKMLPGEIVSEPRICPKLDPFKAAIDEWLESDKLAKAKQRHTAKRVFDRLSTEDGTKETFDCSYRTVADYVAWKKKQIYAPGKDAYLPLEHRPGEAQVDFGSAQFIERGILYDGKYLNVSFPYSNKGYQQLFKGENAECLLEGLFSIFMHIGGVPIEAWFDNASAIVTKIIRGGGREITDKFLRFKCHFGFDAVFCNPNEGHEKGNVEGKVGYHRRNMLVPIPKFDSLEAFNKELLDRCDADGDRPHYRKGMAINELFEADRAALLPMPKNDFDLATYIHLKADNYGKFTLDGGKHSYSGSPMLAGERIIVKLTSYKVIVMTGGYREIVSHKRLYGDTYESSMDWMPYLSQLSIRPRALKYTGIYDMMPDPLKEYISTLKNTDVGKVLREIAKLTEMYGFESAAATVSEALLSGAHDADSLCALHRRLNENIPILPNVVLPKGFLPELLVKSNPDIGTYDAILANGGGL
jgi:transposase